MSSPSEDSLYIGSHSVLSLRSLALDTLREAVIRGDFPPGHRLVERELAERMGISTTPINQALRMLEAEGLVRTVPRRGTFVEDHLPSLLAEASLIRASLEGVAGRLAAIKRSDKELDEMTDQIRRMEEATRLGEIEAQAAANTRFHDQILRASRNRFIQQAIPNLRSIELIIRKRALADSAEAERGLQEHRDVLHAIAARNGERAESVMRAHVLRSARFVLGKRTVVDE